MTNRNSFVGGEAFTISPSETIRSHTVYDGRAFAPVEAVDTRLICEGTAATVVSGGVTTLASRSRFSAVSKIACLCRTAAKLCSASMIRCFVSQPYV